MALQVVPRDFTSVGGPGLHGGGFLGTVVPL